jgi:hypothetical protein
LHLEDDDPDYEPNFDVTAILWVYMIYNSN